ncbi:MAG: hypothetical protein IKX54_05235 [Lachnospiraceae bacterium]|nr:hypothetical protein [Lachnospiraceae bacterium]
MDIKDITKSLLTTANVKAISGQSGATQTQVKSVLTNALPALLSGKKTSAAEISEETGVSKAKTNGILSAAAPLLGGLLGGGSSQQEEKPSGTAALLSGLLGSVNIGSLASGLFSLVSSNDDDEKEEEEEKPKKPKNGKKTDGKKTDGKKTDAKKKDSKKTDSKKPAAKKKTDGKKTEKKEESSSPLDTVTGLLGGLFK